MLEAPVLPLLVRMAWPNAIGGGISLAVARALGSGRRERADALVLHAIALNLVLGLGFSALFLIFGRPIYRVLGGSGGDLEAAVKAGVWFK